MNKFRNVNLDQKNESDLNFYLKHKNRRPLAFAGQDCGKFNRGEKAYKEKAGETWPMAGPCLINGQRTNKYQKDRTKAAKVSESLQKIAIFKDQIEALQKAVSNLENLIV